MHSARSELCLTKDTGRLSMAQRVFYENNGYLVIPRLVSTDILEECSRRFDDIVSGVADRGQLTVMRDVWDRTAVNKVQDLNYDEVFLKYIKNDKLLDLVESFVGPNIMAMHSMLIAKPPDAGHGTSRHPPHQDLYYFPFRPINLIVAAWTAIEPCNYLNGCLSVSPGSHRVQKLHAHGYPSGMKSGDVNKLYHGIQDLPESTIPWTNLEMLPGDTVFFHPLLIHSSGVNVSTGTRKAISCHYAAAECYYIDVTGTMQEQVRNEVLEIIQRRLPNLNKIEFTDLWRIKGTLVRGIRSSL